MQTADNALTVQPAAANVRAAGIIYLLLVVTGIFGFFAPQALIVSNDPSATARNILASETLFRLSIVSGLIATIAFVFLARALYRLLSHVNQRQASLMVVLVLVSIPISFVGSLNEIAALRLIHGPALAGLGTSQMNVLAVFFLGLSDDTSALNSIFFGLWLIPFGRLVIQSGFIPRIFGYLLLIAGGSYLAGSLNFLLAHPFGPVVSTIAAVGFLGELGVVGWLVVKAVQVQFGGADSAIKRDTTSDSNLEGGHAW
jgi:Domain of unknown function (DUF4386)